MSKLYVVSGINDEEWEEILSCIEFSIKFSDDSLKKEDIKKLKNIQIKDLDQNNDIKKYIKNWLRKGD